MKKILVTGGAGYIGSHAVKALLQAGYHVTVIDNLSKGYRNAVDQKAFFLRIDLAHAAEFEEFFAEQQFDAVMHFAGSIEVGLSMNQPVEFFENNCLNGMRLLEVMRKTGVAKIIFSSTAAVYGHPVKVPIPETALLEPTNFYGQSKLFFEQILQKYEQFYGFHSIVLRYFNAAGSDLNGDIGQAYTPDTHLISRLLKTALGQYDVFSIYGTDYETPDGTCVRDYIHVLDLVDAHILALDYLFMYEKSDTFNLGNGNGFSVQQVIAAAEKLLQRKIPVQPSGRRKGDPPFLVADAMKAQKILRWKPRYSDLQTILASAWKWHSLHPHGYED